MIIIHTVDEMKTIVWKNAKRRNEVLKSIICDEKLSFSISIVEYNRYMSELNENAQQRAYYTSYRRDCRYWWSIFIFLLNATVLNAYKLWNHLYLDSKLIHSRFQHQIAEIVMIDEITRKYSSKITTNSSAFKVIDESTSCEWKHTSKKSYCVFCKQKKIRLRKRRAFEEISENFIKKRRFAQIRWQCKNCELCCKKRECWRILHSNSNA